MQQPSRLFGISLHSIISGISSCADPSKDSTMYPEALRPLVTNLPAQDESTYSASDLFSPKKLKRFDFPSVYYSDRQ